MIELKMNFILGNLCIDIELWSRKEQKFIKTDAVFDTGAHTTHIDTNALEELGYDLENAQKSYISTVGSRNIQVNNTVIDNIKIGGLELGAVLVNFSELADINAPAIILGMNVIKEFNSTFDFKRSIISMKPNFDVDSVVSPEKFNKSVSRFGIWTIGINEAK